MAIFKNLSILAKNPIGAPNFLIALGLSCYTEYWGKLSLGIAKDNSRQCYYSFFGRLGTEYQKLINSGYDIYNKVRCGLVHSYMMGSNGIINLGIGNCGITIDYEKDTYVFNIITYFEDFKKAVDTYIEGLESGSEDIGKMEKALRDKPILI